MNETPSASSGRGTNLLAPGIVVTTPLPEEEENGRPIPSDETADSPVPENREPYWRRATESEAAGQRPPAPERPSESTQKPRRENATESADAAARRQDASFSGYEEPIEKAEKTRTESGGGQGNESRKTDDATGPGTDADAAPPLNIQTMDNFVESEAIPVGHGMKVMPMPAAFQWPGEPDPETGKTNLQYFPSGSMLVKNPSGEVTPMSAHKYNKLMASLSKQNEEEREALLQQAQRNAHPMNPLSALLHGVAGLFGTESTAERMNLMTPAERNALAAREQRAQEAMKSAAGWRRDVHESNILAMNEAVEDLNSVQNRMKRHPNPDYQRLLRERENLSPESLTGFEGQKRKIRIDREMQEVIQRDPELLEMRDQARKISDERAMDALRSMNKSVGEIPEHVWQGMDEHQKPNLHGIGKAIGENRKLGVNVELGKRDKAMEKAVENIREAITRLMERLTRSSKQSAPTPHG